ncbi:hypothetical protein FKM82_005810 [Ascaphus truei]
MGRGVRRYIIFTTRLQGGVGRVLKDWGSEEGGCGKEVFPAHLSQLVEGICYPGWSNWGEGSPGVRIALYISRHDRGSTPHVRGNGLVDI